MRGSPGTLLHVAAILLLVLDLGGTTAKAQRKSGPARFAVDRVTLRSGERFRGAFLDVSDDGIVSMAVQREWLRTHRSEMYDEVAASELKTARKAAAELRARIEKWLAEKPDSNNLRAFLEAELNRAKARVGELDESGRTALESQFVVVKFPRHEVEYSFAQPPKNRRIALLAWSERLDDVETREADNLLKQLRELGIDPAVDEPNLADRLPAITESDTQWAARRALVEYGLAEKLDFQGIGNALFRTGGKARQRGLEELLPELLPKLLEDQLGGQLGDLLNPPGGSAKPQPAGKPDYQSAIDEAERTGHRGFRVTTVDLNLKRGEAKVETRFVARTGPGKWQTIWSHKETADASKPRPDTQKRIRNDPQVAQALKLIESLGVGAGKQLGTALNFGSATMEAQKAADAEFARFIDRYLRHLDGPELDWSR